MIKKLALLMLLALLSACASKRIAEPKPALNARQIEALADAVPRVEKLHAPSLRPYSVNGKPYTPMTSLAPYRERGLASWYGQPYHGRSTAIGETYDMYGMSAAHTLLPLPSYVRVKNVSNGRQVVVRVNDRGPFVEGRVIDLSYAAASKLGMVGVGLSQVELELLTGQH